MLIALLTYKMQQTKNVYIYHHHHHRHSHNHRHFVQIFIIIQYLNSVDHLLSFIWKFVQTFCTHFLSFWLIHWYYHWHYATHVLKWILWCSIIQTRFASSLCKKKSLQKIRLASCWQGLFFILCNTYARSWIRWGFGFGICSIPCWFGRLVLQRTNEIIEHNLQQDKTT